MNPFLKQSALGLAGTAWLLVTGSLLALLARYSHTPAEPGLHPEVWPTESRLRLDEIKPSLFVFFHPQCPCSRSSLAELELALTQCHELVRTHVIFADLPGTGPDWMTGPLVERAQKVVGVTVLFDGNGVEAARFGAETSGTTLLYSPTGELLFSGGLTAARNHQGDNPGRTALIRVARGEPAVRETPVFGCPIFDDASVPLPAAGTNPAS